MVTIETDQETDSAVQCALGVKRNGSGGLDLLLLGKDKTPLLKVPLKKTESQQQPPISMKAERTNDDAGRITLRILGRYEASFEVTELEQ